MFIDPIIHLSFIKETIQSDFVLEEIKELLNNKTLTNLQYVFGYFYHFQIRNESIWLTFWKAVNLIGSSSLKNEVFTLFQSIESSFSPLLRGENWLEALTTLQEIGTVQLYLTLVNNKSVIYFNQIFSQQETEHLKHEADRILLLGSLRAMNINIETMTPDDRVTQSDSPFSKFKLTQKMVLITDPNSTI